MDVAGAKDLFVAEAMEYVQQLNDGILQLEENPEDEELVETVFRAAHSLKGMSATMGFEPLVELTHRIEDVFDALRNGQLHLEQEKTDILLAAVDGLERLVSEVAASQGAEVDFQQDGPAGEVPDLCGQLDSILESPQEVSSDGEGGAGAATAADIRLDDFEREVLGEAYSRGMNSYIVTVQLRPGSVMKSVRVFMVFKAIEKLGDIIKAVPPVEDLEEERFEDTFHLIVVTGADEDEVCETILSISEVESVECRLLAPGGESASEDGQRREAALDEEQNEPERGAAPNQAGRSQEAVEATPQPPNRGATSTGKGAATSAAGTSGKPKERRNLAAGSLRRLDKVVRVETDRLDKLINLVGELVINRTRLLAGDLSEEQREEAIEQLDRLTTDLQDAVMQLRMVPIKQVFDRFPRVVRDISVSRNKKVRLQMSGEETELDRSIVNAIADPLIHLLRNSIDHGIEPPEERLAAGKPAEGIVRLMARHEGSHVVIEIADDGRGIDADVVRRKAVEKGLISADEANGMSDDEAIQLIFRSGFSTSDVVSDISGRGVGMDVVRQVTRSLNGSIEVDTNPGQGSRFTIRLPLTLAIISALLVTAGGETYAIPAEAVQENLDLASQQVKTINGEPVVSWRGYILPLISLRRKLAIKCSQTYEGKESVIVVQSGEQRAGLVVDDIIGLREIVIKPLGDYLGDIKGISGATVLASGKVALILDVRGLIA